MNNKPDMPRYPWWAYMIAFTVIVAVAALVTLVVVGVPG